MGTNWAFYNVSERALISFAISTPRRYWNFFSTPVVKGFRSELTLMRSFTLGYFFNKAMDFLTFVSEKNRTRFLLFGLLIRDQDSRSQMYNTRGYLRVFFELLNVVVVGNVWPGGALTNFKKFKIHNSYYFFKTSIISRFRYYPNVSLSTFYNYETISLGFESMACAVPMIAPIDASLDPSILSYPIPISSSSINMSFMANFFLLKVFQGSLIRFVNFSDREDDEDDLLLLKGKFFTERWN